MNPAADLCRRLRNPSWPESIPLSALEAMEEAARVIESGLKPAPAKAPPLWYVATYGETGVHGGPVDCLCDVSFYDSPLAYGRACKAAARLHDSGDIDSYTMGPAMAPNAEAKARAAAIAKAQKRAARAEAKAAAAKAKEEAAAKAEAQKAAIGKGGPIHDSAWAAFHAGQFSKAAKAFERAAAIWEATAPRLAATARNNAAKAKARAADLKGGRA